jgi:uncharacterized damage-inducible protein DinB
MATTESAVPVPGIVGIPSPRQQFLDAYEREHATTMRVLRAYPADRADLRPHPRCKTARELAFVFALERGLGEMVMNGAFADGGGPGGEMPQPPEAWDDVLAAVEQAHQAFGERVRAIPDDQLFQPVKFFVAPRTLGDIPTIQFVWMLLCDEIHHRGQFSVYLRMADGRVPSIYGPTADEPWM